MCIIKSKLTLSGSRQFFIGPWRVLSYKPHNVFALLRKRYKHTERYLYNKIKHGKPIRVVFMVSLSSMFPARPLLKKMTSDKRFDVSVLVIPDFSFGIERAQKDMAQCAKELQKYAPVIVAPIKEEDDNINISKIADIVFYQFPYINFSHKKYEVETLVNSGILVAHINYTFPDNIYNESFLKSPLYSMFWRVFAETDLSYREICDCSLINGSNVVLTGYCKMDEYEPQKKKTNKKRKTIMIAPHHSIDGGYNPTLRVANFLKYSDLFLQLPKMYPDIDFIFRPHPALFPCLSQDKFWGQATVDKYIQDITSNKNVRYSTVGNYFDDFVKSDALIQDCCSFLVEYFYTGKPQCYMLRDKTTIESQFSELGKRCLSHCYQAFSQNHIIKFIENVVIKESDSLAKSRKKFANNEIMLNYPNVSQEIINQIIKTITKE